MFHDRQNRWFVFLFFRSKIGSTDFRICFERFARKHNSSFTKIRADGTVYLSLLYLSQILKYWYSVMSEKIKICQY